MKNIVFLVSITRTSYLIAIIKMLLKPTLLYLISTCIMNNYDIQSRDWFTKNAPSMFSWRSTYELFVESDSYILHYPTFSWSYSVISCSRFLLLSVIKLYNSSPSISVCPIICRYEAGMPYTFLSSIINILFYFIVFIGCPHLFLFQFNLFYLHLPQTPLF